MRQNVSDILNGFQKIYYKQIFSYFKLQFDIIIIFVSKHMIIKTLLLTSLLVFAICYTEQENVLVLSDEDFPGVISEFSHILIQFYAPWCGHCQKLAPVYTEVAKQLKELNSSVRLAKVDATQQKKAADQYQIQGFPTLYFFMNGQKIKYKGPRNTEGMLAWVLKRSQNPLEEINLQRYNQLQSQESVSIVYHGDISRANNSQIFRKLAIADDYNMYYWGKDLEKEEGTIEIIRNFDAPAIYTSGIDANLELWIHKNQRPLVVPFDQRTISTMFQVSNKKGLVFFNNDDSEELHNTFVEAVKEYQGDIYIFTEVKSDDEHIDNFPRFLKLDRRAYPIVLINSKEQLKYVLKKQLTKENILEFLQNYNDFKYGISQDIDQPEETEQQQTKSQAQTAQQQQKTEEAAESADQTSQEL